MLDPQRPALGVVRERVLEDAPSPIRVGLFAVGAVVAWIIADRTLPYGLPPGIVVFGLTFGSLYALTAIGLVLIHRATRVVNFAQAEIGAVAAMVTITMLVTFRTNYFLAAAAGVAVAVATGTLVNILVIRRFRKAPRFLVAVATIGVASILSGASLALAVGASGLRAQRVITPFNREMFTIFPVLFRGDAVLAMVTAPVIMAVLALFLRYSNYGVAIRAAAENSDRAHLLGVPVPRLSTVVWSIAAVLSAATVVLRVPLVGFATTVTVHGGGESLLIRTLGAAVIGRMTSLPRTVAAALTLGVIQEAAAWNLRNTDYVDAVLVLVVLGAILSQRGFYQRLKDFGEGTWRQVRPVRPIPHELRDLPEVKIALRALRGALFALAVAVPWLVGPSLVEGASLVFIYGTAALSLLVLTGWAGQISLGNWAIAGFGAATTALLAGRFGWDALAAMLVGVAVGAAVALIIALPTVGARGPFLAVSTLAFAVATGYFFLEDRYIPWYHGPVKRPRLVGLVPLEREWQMYYFAFAVMLCTMYVVRNLRKTRTGRAIIAVRENEAAAEAFSLTPTRLKATAFVIAGALAGLAGAVHVVHQRGFSIGSYQSVDSIAVFSIAVIGGLGSMWGVVLGAAYIEGAKTFLPGALAPIASGTGVLLLLMFLPEGLGSVLYQLRDGFLRRVARRRNLIVPSLVADPWLEPDDPSGTFAAVVSERQQAELNGQQPTVRRSLPPPGLRSPRRGRR